MSVLTSAHPAHHHHLSGEGFFRHVAQAARSLREALAAARRRRAALRDAEALMQLCRRYEDTMPNLAGELRFMASRG